MPIKNSRDDWTGYISFDNNLHFLASTIEDVNTPPQVVLYDLQNGQLTTLTTLNDDKKILR